MTLALDKLILKFIQNRESPDGPVVRALHFTTGDTGLIPGQELRSRMLCCEAKMNKSNKNIEEHARIARKTWGGGRGRAMIEKKYYQYKKPL